MVGKIAQNPNQSSVVYVVVNPLPLYSYKNSLSYFSGAFMAKYGIYCRYKCKRSLHQCICIVSCEFAGNRSSSFLSNTISRHAVRHIVKKTSFLGSGDTKTDISTTISNSIFSNHYYFSERNSIMREIKTQTIFYRFIVRYCWVVLTRLKTQRIPYKVVNVYAVI